jgi:hypothetical protein
MSLAVTVSIVLIAVKLVMLKHVHRTLILDRLQAPLVAGAGVCNLTFCEHLLIYLYVCLFINVFNCLFKSINIISLFIYLHSYMFINLFIIYLFLYLFI